MAFDIKTLLLINLIINVITTISMTMIWYHYRRRFNGTLFWLSNTVMHTIGIALILVRGHIPDYLSIVASNTLLVLGAILILTGLERFIGKKGIKIHNYVLVFVYFLLINYFHIVMPNMAMREIVLSAIIIILYSQSCYIMFRHASVGLRSMTRFVGIVMVGYVVVSMIRLVLLFAYPSRTSDFFRSGVSNQIAIIGYLSLHILVIISLILMVTRRLLIEIQAQEEKFSKIFHSSPYAILLSRLTDGYIYEVNNSFVRITGYEKDEVIGKTALELNLWDNLNELSLIEERVAHNETETENEIRIVKKSGEVIIGQFSADSIVINNELCVISSITDITEQARLKNKLVEMATHDALTGLPNRVLLYDIFEKALLDAKRQSHMLCAMSIDLDGFKEINDTYGHEIGDFVLIEAARRFRNCMRHSDIISRFGGDEFLLLLPQIDYVIEAENVAKNILDCTRQPIVLEGHQLSLSASIGISLFPDHGDDMKDLIRKSDEALYIAKLQKDGFALYHKNVH